MMNMSRNKGMWIALSMLILAVGAAAAAVDGVSCGDALTKLLSCKPFLFGSTDAITVACCDNAVSVERGLVGSGGAERKILCGCLKKVAAAMGAKPGRASLIPQLCHVSFPVPIPVDPTVNCDSF